jgi:hypothetical protein
LVVCLRIFFLGVFLFSVTGCSATPPPPEAKLAEAQEQSLWGAGASVYAPSEYDTYKSGLSKAKDLLLKEEARLNWLRQYEPARDEYKKVLAQGERVLKLIEERKAEKSSAVRAKLQLYANRLETSDRLSSIINEGRLARRSLTHAEILLGEARALSEAGKYFEAEAKLIQVPEHLRAAEEALSPVLSRLLDKNQIATWQRWVEDTVARSKATGAYAIVVSKIDRSLILYKAGRPVATYGVGLGRNGSLDKLHQGDGATPEGKYYITKKLPRSRYYKALLINYPNEEDRSRFAEAKRKGLISRRVGIGGLVEIHGGGKDSMTYGCVGLEDGQMEELYNRVEVGTPVTIVGALDHKAGIAKALNGT